MDTGEVNYFCDQLDKSCDEYLNDTKKILCGKNNDIQFFIQNKILQWKRNMWTLGKIELHSILDIQIICESFQQLLKVYQNIQDEITTLKEENTNLADTNKELSSKVEKMIEIKRSMEQNLYEKFIMVLNSKKKKIKELEAAGKDKQNTSESNFNAATDESDELEQVDETVNIVPKEYKNDGKRKSLDYNGPESLQKNRKIDYINHENTNHKASCSKDYTNDKVCALKDCESIEEKNIYGQQSCSAENRNSRSSLNFVEEESEEELFSQ